MHALTHATLLLLTTPALLVGQDARSTPIPEAPLQVASYDLDVSYHRDAPHLTGVAHVSFKTPPAASGSSGATVFYLHNEMTVDSVVANGRTIAFSSREVDYYYSYSTRALRTAIDSPHSPADRLTIFYHGPMRPSVSRSESDYMRVDSSGVFLRGYGYSLWFPTFLEAGQSSYEVRFANATLRTPPGFRSVFIGSRVREASSESGTVSVWRADPVDLLAVQWTAQRFEVEEGGNYRAYHAGDAPSREAARTILAFAEAVTDRYRQSYRPRNGDQEGYLVEMPPYGMIASLNVSALPREDWTSFDKQLGTKIDLAHELVHSFVQFPSIPFSSPMWALVIEGFPSYFHYPVLGELLGQEFYEERIAAIEAGYLRRRASGTTRGGQALPPEKPLLDLTPDDLPVYKDRFVLNDRATLFFDWLRTRMGTEEFNSFTRDLFGRPTLTEALFLQIIDAHLPAVTDDVALWLHTTEFPERFHHSRSKPVR